MYNIVSRSVTNLGVYIRDHSYTMFEHNKLITGPNGLLLINSTGILIKKEITNYQAAWKKRLNQVKFDSNK